jgi:hypothetical protein
MADPLRAYPAPHDEHTDHPAGEALERRVRRLEDAVAAIQDTQLMEDRVVERVVGRVEHTGPQPLSGGPGLFVSAARMLLPKTIDALPEDGSVSADGSPPPTAAAQAPWLVMAVLRDLRWIVRMLTDYRYRMSWTGRIVLMAAIVVGFLSWFVLSGLPIVGGIIDRVVLVLLAVVTYKAMSREVQRYQELMARVWRSTR